MIVVQVPSAAVLGIASVQAVPASLFGQQLFPFRALYRARDKCTMTRCCRVVSRFRGMSGRTMFAGERIIISNNGVS
jgi:hypothetical protein